MKRIFTILTFTVVCGAMFGQSQRMVFLEEFTQASCPPCEQTTPALNAIVEANIEKIVQIRYHTWWPGFDPLHLDNESEVRERVDYYGVNGVPDLFKDGQDAVGSGNDLITQQEVDQRYDEPSAVAMSMEHSFNADYSAVDITLTIRNEDTVAYDLAEDRLRLAFVEEIIRFPEPPGTTSLQNFESVMKRFITGTAGMEVGMIMPGDSLVMSWTEEALPEKLYDIRTVALVAWIQNDDDRSVVNATTSHPLEIAGGNNVSLTIDGYENDLCAEGISGMATVTNEGDVNSTGLRVWAILNGETTPLSDELSLAPGEMTSVDLSALELESNLNEIDFNVSVNGSASSSPNDLDYFDSEATGFLAPKAGPGTDEFERTMEADIPGQFPAGASVDAPRTFVFITVDQQFVSGANPVGGFLESEQSLFVFFYGWNPGEVPGEATMDFLDRYNVPMDGAELTFDHAYTSFQGSQDRLIIEVSTDCGESFTTVFDKAGEELRTAPEINSNQAFFVPTSMDHWVSNQVDLSEFAGETILIRLRAESQWGDNLYLDNINVSGIVATEEVISEEELQFYPNPATDQLFINYDGQIDMVEMYNSTGTLTRRVSNATNSIDISEMSAGIYLMKAYDNNRNKVATRKIMIK